MTLDERSSMLLMYLINSDSYLSIDELSEKLKVSRRTLYYDIEKINSWLSDNKLNNVKYIRSVGFYIDNETKELVPDKIKTLEKWHYEYSSKERKAWLAINILTTTKKLFLNDLMKIIRVSRNTTISDLKTLKEEIKKFNVVITAKRKNGYVVEGSEHNKRKALIFYLSQVISKKGWNDLTSQIQIVLNSNQKKEEHDNLNLFQNEKINQIYKIISDCEKNLGIQFTYEVLHNLSFQLLLFMKRFLQGKQVNMDPVEKKVLKSTKEYLAAKHISEKLEELFEISFPEDEIFYITTHILGAKVNYYKSYDIQNESEANLRKVIYHMVNDFQKYSCVYFREREKLEESLMIHLKPAYYRVKYGLDVDNPLTESIKEKYKEIYLLTEKVIHHLERCIGKEVSDDEIAFIAMHFGGWMEREGVVPAARKKVLLVCANGVGTSRILKSQLEGLFSTIDIIETVSLREYENNEYNVDFVVSTTPIDKKGQEVFLVSPILSDIEKQSLLKKVKLLLNKNDIQSSSIEALIEIISRNASIHNKQRLYQELKQYIYKPMIDIKEAIKPMLSDLITENKIQLKDSVKSWEKAIKLAAKPLLDEEYIDDSYVDAMINSVREIGPYIIIAPKVAIPHGRPEQGVKKLGMSFLRLSEGVNFSDKEEHKVYLIIVLAAIDNETHLKALAQLSKLLSEGNNIEKLINTISVNEILEMIKKYSNE